MRSLSLCVIITILVGFTNGEPNNDGGNWGYKTGKTFDSPYHWKDIQGASCGGQRQSPINIDVRNANFNDTLKPVTISKKGSSSTMVLLRTARSLQLTFSDMWDITFGGRERLKPTEIHWHWGLTNDNGSEHTINSNKYSMEGHIVTYDNEQYPSLDIAMQSRDGIHVFSILYKIGASNPTIDKIVPKIDSVITNKQTPLDEISLEYFFPANKNDYFQYNGSLTTPPCTENVIWTVFNEIQNISQEQMSKFRQLPFGAPESGKMGDNFRPMDSFGTKNRVVWKSFRSHGSINTYHIWTVGIILLSYTVYDRFKM